jgi:nicotinate phosphoribosyltransferase
LLTEEHVALFVDYYELTMGQADFDSSKNSICTENYFARAIPQGEYLIAAGLEQVIQYILNLRFSEGDLQWLQNSKYIPEMSPRFVDYLRNFKFDGDVYAVPEGTIVLPNEPIINITGNSIDIQSFETYLCASVPT